MKNIRSFILVSFLICFFWDASFQSAAASPKKLIFAIDGLSSSAFEAAQSRGLFANFTHWGKHISPYPSMTEPSWTEILGGKDIFPLQGNVKSIEAKYFDIDSLSMVDDNRNLFSRYALPFNYVRAFDYIFNPYLETLMYLPIPQLNDGLIKKEFEQLEGEIYENFKADHFIAYVSSVDAIAHTQIERLFPVLTYLDEMITKVEKHYADLKVDVEITLVSDHGNVGKFKEGVEETFLNSTHLNEAIGLAGLELVEGKLTQDNQISIPLLALGSMANVYFKDLTKRRLFAVFALQNPAVDLVTYLEITGDQKYLVVLGRENTEARIFWRKGIYAYQSIVGNPLQLPNDLVSKGMPLRWKSDADLFEGTKNTKYPDALFRLVQSADKQVANTPDLIVNLNDHTCFESSFSKMVKMVRTHGSLSAGASLGILASNTRPVPDFIRSRDILAWIGIKPQQAFHKAEDYFHTSPRAALEKVQEQQHTGIPTRIKDLSSDLLFLRATKMVSGTRDYITPKDFSDLVLSKWYQKEWGFGNLSQVAQLTHKSVMEAHPESNAATLPSLPDSLKETLPDILKNFLNPPAEDSGKNNSDLPLTKAWLAEDGRDLIRDPGLLFREPERSSQLFEKLSPEWGIDHVPALASIIRRSVMKGYAFPDILDDILNIPERDYVKDTRNLEFAEAWLKTEKAKVLQDPDRLFRDKELAAHLFQEIFNERKLLQFISPATFPLLYNPASKDITVVFVPGIYNELFDQEIFSKGLRALREQLGLRVLYADVDGRCSSDINAKSIISFLKEDTQQRLARGYETPRYLIMGYSKGGVDATEGLLVDPKFTRSQIMGLLSIASPHHGTSIIQVADIPSVLIEEVVPRPIPQECKTSPASKSISPEAREAFWTKNLDRLRGLTRFYSLSFVAEVQESHPWMKLTKQIARFGDIPNDGVVTEESTKFPEVLHPIDLGTLEKTDHLAGILASKFPQAAFLEAALLYLFETRSFNKRTLMANYQAVAQESPSLFADYHKRAILGKFRVGTQDIVPLLKRFTGVMPPWDRTQGKPRWYDSVQRTNDFLAHPLQCIPTGELTEIAMALKSSTAETSYALKPISFNCDPTLQKIQVRIETYKPHILQIWKSPTYETYDVKTVDDLVTVLLSKAMATGKNKIDPASLGGNRIPKSNRVPITLPESSVAWTEEQRIDLTKLEEMMATAKVKPIGRADRENIQIIFDHTSFKDFRKEYHFSYESWSPTGIDDNAEKGYIPVRDLVAPGQEETVARMKTIGTSIRLTTAALRFKPSDFPNLNLKLKVTQGVKGANPRKGGSGKDDSAFQVWFTLFNLKSIGPDGNTKPSANDVKLFGYHWGDENEEGLLKPGTLIENTYSNYRIPIIGRTLPEAWQIVLEGGSTSLALGKWSDFKRNLAQDLRAAFPDVPGIADWQVVLITFQSDSKDMGSSSEAFFKELSLK